MTADRFGGFPPAGLDLLAELGHEDKVFLDAHRGTYEDDLAAPAKAFVAAMAERLADEVSPGIVGVAKAGGSISPINNDRRFRPDAPAYKDHLLLRWWEGEEKRTAPTLFLRIGRDDVGVAVGAALPDLGRWRAAVDDERSGPALVAALESLRQGRDLQVVGDDLKRVPAPYPADHPRAALLRHKGFQARWIEPAPAAITSARFVDWCTRRLVACAPVHRWLVEELG